MNKLQTLKTVNTVLAIAFLTLGLTAMLHNYIPYSIYRRIHPLAGYVFSALVVTHVILNYGWIKKNILKK
ncbi:MAG: hypothetical protein Q8S24_02185 [Eubacteriales bacterium]|nr:hypothetical protein [Eubacteriales bacterium]